MGSKAFVVQPKGKRIFISKGGSSYWPCKGYINSKLIGIVYNELKSLSAASNVAPPDGKRCFYSIGNLQIFGKNIPTYSVNMYVDKKRMESCLFRNYCADFRTMNFVVKREKLFRQYMVTNVSRKLTKFMCVSMKGQLINMGHCK